jgi:hypothetical protein
MRPFIKYRESAADCKANRFHSVAASSVAPVRFVAPQILPAFPNLDAIHPL